MTMWWLEKARATIAAAPDGPWEYDPEPHGEYGGAVLGTVETTRAGLPRKDGRRELLLVSREWEDEEGPAVDLCRYVGRFDPPTITALLDVLDAASRLDGALVDAGIPVDGPVISPWLDVRSAIERVRLLALERDAYTDR